MTSCTGNTNNEKDKDTSAGKNTEKNQPEITTGHKQTDADIQGCYIKILQLDTFAMHLIQTTNSVTGKLTFNNYEKDKSSGTVHGIIEGSIIKLWYNFASEGMNSVMEIYFKEDGTQLVRGIGAVDAKGDTSYYTNHSGIQYPQNQSFNKIECDDLPGKYK